VAIKFISPSSLLYWNNRYQKNLKKELLAPLMVIMLLLVSCGSDKQRDMDNQAQPQQEEAEAPAQPVVVNENAPHDKSTEFIVISKKDLRLTVYAPSGKDTVAIAQFPVCVGKNKGNKEGSGDMRTPESPAGEPFTITNIQDASTWTHDFGDGRGSILAYGNWFMRLKTYNFKGIGIHGSTNNESSVPGRGSEGCIRLRNDDLDVLKERYAFVGMKVVILKDE
jgi:lipoprotein-anchoring transpeptidase ErfK/SrfK